MSHKYFSAALLASLLALTSAAEARKELAAPAGKKVVSGKQFDIYIKLKESGSFAATRSMLNIYSTTIVIHKTRKHDSKRFVSRFESIDADLLDPSMWRVGDYNGDGFEDFRAVASISSNGCRTWATQTWRPDRERFIYAAKITYLTNARGRKVKSCFPRKQKRN